MSTSAYDPRPAAIHGLRPDCVAEVIALTADHGLERGSGYRVAPAVVLTATHAVSSALRIRVRFNADADGEWESPVSTVTVAGELALLTLETDRLEGRVRRAGFGTFADRAAVARIHAAGFPRFKLKADQATANSEDRSFYRDLHHATGWTAIASNRRSRTLEMNVDPPDRDPTGRSPWEGMSGSAAWVNGRIVGVVSEHFPADGLGRLTVRRVDQELNQADDDRRRAFCAALGIEGAELPLDDLTPIAPHERLIDDYRSQAADMAPASGLRGRDQEISDLTVGCVGGEMYQWWQGVPWSGKSAMIATFVSRPPEGLDIISFFVNAADVGQADSTAFNRAIAEQLSAMVGDDDLEGDIGAVRDVARHRLLRRAAARAAADGRRLVLVVDGIDEDVAVRNRVRGLPSIASFLPKGGMPGLSVIVTSRSQWNIPNDVAPDHPLRSCTVRTLEPSALAEDLRVRAAAELDQLLSSGETGRDLAGLLAASGGGLSMLEICELTGMAPFQVESHLAWTFTRTVTGRTGSLRGSDSSGSVYIFAHRTLRAVAADRLGYHLMGDYRDRIHRWATRYSESGWPGETPTYLLARYERMLAANGDLDRMVDLATDMRMQARLRSVTGSVFEPLRRIGAVQETIVASMSSDDGRGQIVILARLAIHRLWLTESSSVAPVDMPQVLGMMGEVDSARELALAMPAGPAKNRALCDVVGIFAEKGELAEAHSLIKQITASKLRSAAEVRVVRSLCRRGHLDEAVRLTTLLKNDAEKDDVLVDVIKSLCAASELSRAEALAVSIVSEDSRLDAFAAIVIARVSNLRGSRDFATQVAGLVEQPSIQLRLAVRIAFAWLRAGRRGDADLAMQFALQRIALLPAEDASPHDVFCDAAILAAILADIDAARNLSSAISDSYWRSEALRWVGICMSKTSDLPEVMKWLSDVRDVPITARTMFECVVVAARAERQELATSIAARAVDVVATIPDHVQRSRLYAEGALSFAAAGIHQAVDVALSAIGDDELRLRTMAAAAGVGADRGDVDVVRRTLASFSQSSRSVARFGGLADDVIRAITIAAARVGDHSYVGRLLDEMMCVGSRRAAMYAGISRDLSERGRLDEAAEYARKAIDQASDPGELWGTLADALTRALCGKGKWSEARMLADKLDRSQELLNSILSAADRCVSSGQVDSTGRSASELLEEALRLTDSVPAAAMRATYAARGAEVAATGKLRELARRFVAVCTFALSDIVRVWERVRLIASLVDTTRRIASHDQSLGLAREAVRLVVDLHNVEVRGEAAVAIAPSLVRRDFAGGLAELIESTRANSFWRSRLEAVISIALVEVGSVTRARASYESACAAARSIELESRRDEVVCDLGVVCCVLYGGDVAVAVTAAIGDDAWRCRGLQLIVSKLCQRGEVAMASAIVERAFDAGRQRDTWAELARAAHETGDSVLARNLARKALDSAADTSVAEDRVRLVANAASAAIVVGLTRGAMSGLADIVEDCIHLGPEADYLRSRLARTAADAGDIDLAKQLTASIVDGYWRCYALGGVAGRLAAAGRVGASRAAVGECLAMDGWGASVDELCSIEPDLAGVLAKELLRVVTGR